MKYRICALLTTVALLLSLAVGCADTPTTSVPTDDGGKQVPQLSVALNPVYAYDNGDVVVAYNDLNKAMQSDYDNASLTSLSGNTGWQWAYRTGEQWALRAIYDLSRWQNGVGATVKKTNAYLFSADRTVSLMPYDTARLMVTPYGTASLPDKGVLLTVGGTAQEGLCYTVDRTGVLQIPAGTVTAVEAVGGVNTGFLAEDGTPRQAAVSIIANSRTLWSGTLCNATAGDGTAVTTLSYPAITGIPVTAGDCIIISVTLDAEANRAEDVTPAPDDEAVSNGGNVDVDTTPGTSHGSGTTEQPKAEALSFIDNLASRFVVVRQSDASATEQAVVQHLRTRMDDTLATEVVLRNENHRRTDYEIIVGKVDGLALSAQLYEDLKGYRVNNADDYIIRRVGTKVYIAAAHVSALQQAVDNFLTTYCKDDKSAVPASLNVVHRDKKAPLLIDGANAAAFTIRIQRHPSYWEVASAEHLQEFLMHKTGYVLPMVRGGSASAHDIQVGPQNDGVDALWNADETRFVGVEDSGYLKGDYAAYAITVKGGHLQINGGSSHAVNAAVQAMETVLKDKAVLPAGFAATGSYGGGYTLDGGYGLGWSEEFDYNEGSDAANEKALKKKWYISGDTTAGPTKLGDDQWDEQRRPGKYGENYWVKDGMLWEITKWAPYGYDAVRLTTQDRMYFRYGLLEVRMVPATRNGACSAVWTHWDGLNYADAPEFDIYENFGKDAFIHAAISWHQGPSEATYRTHFGAGISETWTTPEKGEHFYDGFHYIGFRWLSDEVAYYIDGRCTYTHPIAGTDYDALRGGTVLKLANGVGTREYTWNVGGFDPYDCLEDVSSFYETQLVDYARIYRLDRQDHILKTR